MFEILLIILASSGQSDSLRMETINGKPYVVYQVGAKETLYSISRRYGTTILAILEQNPTADAGLEVGQILKVPYAPRVKNQPATQTADGLLHKVGTRETLFSIARQYNVSVDDIKTWNNLKDNSLSLGQDIIIKRKPPADPVVTTTTPSAAKTHAVAPKETLFSISRQYGMTIQQLKDWNGIEGNELKVGQVLTVAVPASSATANLTATTLTTTTVNPVLQTDNTVKISESVSGSDEVKESGLAQLIEGSESNRKYLAQHQTIKPGTILKIRNLTTNQEVFVRVTGPIPIADAGTLIRISKSAYDRLGAVEPKFPAEITYYK